MLAFANLITAPEGINTRTPFLNLESPAVLRTLNGLPVGGKYHQTKPQPATVLQPVLLQCALRPT